MPIYFENKEPMDIRGVSIMGLSVKDGEDPIGYFGTGLKYAIAVLLREGCEVLINVEDTLYVFDRRIEEFRGKPVELITMNGEVLGFTTDLGKNWELWMAYRELASNALDENGEINLYPSSNNATSIMVISEEFELIHKDRASIFLESDPIEANKYGEVHKVRSGEFAEVGPRYGFYRGIKADNFRVPSLFKYNVKSELMLTEDRTIKYSFMYASRVAMMWAQSTNKELIRKVLLSDNNVYEGELSFQGLVRPTDEFLEVCSEESDNMNLNYSARKLAEEFTPMAPKKKANLGDFDKREIEKALVLVNYLVDCNLEEINFVDDLGKGIFGVYESDQIFIDRKTIERGHRFLAGTIYEEILHRDTGMLDNSREMQNYLLDKLMYQLELTNDG